MTVKMLSKVHGHNLVSWAKDKENVIVLSADLTSSTEIDLFRDAYPERFFSMGIAEQNMISVAGGLSREGFVPFVHTFAVFIYRRAYDQIAMSVAYPNLPVKMFGFLPGITSPGGATHQAVEDIALMRALPNMTVLECGDAADVKSVLDIAYAVQGPVYIRMLRGDIPFIFNDPMQLGKARVISEGNDIALFSSGICTHEALRAMRILEKQGLSIQHMHVTTLKPFDDPQIPDALSRARYGVISMENHTVIGGLGSALAEVIAEKGIGTRLVKIGLQDTFAHGASCSYLMKEYGLDALSLITACEGLLKKKLHIREDDMLDLLIPHVTETSRELKSEDL
ncbi:MAG: transketolase family protein [bacterium]